MTLPELTLPKVDLPFDIPILLHPSVEHFAIALPVIVLLLEFYNLFVRRKSIGAFSFILLVLTVGIFALSYLTGNVDGKEAYDLLSPEGQAELKEHKLLGTYLLLASVVVLFFKLLAMTGKVFFRFLFFVALIAMMLVTFEQGKHGGELVYKYGANVEKVKALDDALFDAQEELEEAQEKLDKAKKSVQLEKTLLEVNATEEKDAKVESSADAVKEKTMEADTNTLEEVKKEFEEAMRL